MSMALWMRPSERISLNVSRNWFGLIPATGMISLKEGVAAGAGGAPDCAVAAGSSCGGISMPDVGGVAVDGNFICPDAVEAVVVRFGPAFQECLHGGH